MTTAEPDGGFYQQVAFVYVVCRLQTDRPWVSSIA